MQSFTIRARLRTPIILRGQITLDALLMSVLGRGDVSDLLKCVDELYFASSAFPEDLGLNQRASFVASMRPEHTPVWRELIQPNTRTEGLPKEAVLDGARNTNDLRIGLARQREAGNILNDYVARSTPTVEWFGVGHPDKVLSVLKDVPFIGKKRTAGYGEVESWEVSEGELDGIVGYGDEPLRPIPVDRWEHGGNWVAVEAAWKAPYWDVRNRTKCFVPGSA